MRIGRAQPVHPRLTGLIKYAAPASTGTVGLIGPGLCGQSPLVSMGLAILILLMVL